MFITLLVNLDNSRVVKRLYPIVDIRYIEDYGSYQMFIMKDGARFSVNGSYEDLCNGLDRSVTIANSRFSAILPDMRKM